MRTPQAAGVTPFSINYLGQLQPTNLPPGIVFGGGGNSFERRVDLSGTLGVVGAGLFRQGADQGHAYVFDFSNPANIHQIADLRASDHSAGNEFGDGVAVSGNYIFVGAWGDSSDRGAVYMYDVSNPQNIIERKITAFDAAPYNEFGFSLAVDGSRLIVGAPKFSAAATQPAAAYIVDFSNPNNITQKKIPSNFPGLGGGYGESVGISGNYAIVGRSDDSAAFPFAGSAYLYDITNLNAIVEKRLTPTDAPNYTAFGRRVSISGTKALVSVTSDPGPGDPPGAPEGTVWAFDFSNWNSIKQSEYGRSTFQSGLFTPPFGRFLDLQGNLGLAAAFNEDSQGAVYFNDVSNVLAPTQLFRLPAQPGGGPSFGTSLAIDGSRVLVSDSGGHVYLYQLVPEPSCMFYAIVAIGCCFWPGRRGALRQAP